VVNLITYIKFKYEYPLNVVTVDRCCYLSFVSEFNIFCNRWTTVTLHPTDTAFTVEEGVTITPIICRSDCNPPCTFQWIHMTNDGNMTTSVTSVLNLGKSKINQAGIYICEAFARAPVLLKDQRKQSQVVSLDVIGKRNYRINNSHIHKTPMLRRIVIYL